jgi:hypothetical protein
LSIIPRYVSNDGGQYWSQVVFEIFVDPDSYSVGKQTIGLTGRIDPEIPNHEIEWTTVAQGSTVLYGLLVKLQKAHAKR